MLFSLLLFILFLQCIKTVDITTLLSKNETTEWYKNETYLSESPNFYCTVCCLNISTRTIGKHCGHHTMCIFPDDKIGPACKGFINIEFTHIEQVSILDMHNTIRNMVAMGLETRGKTGPLPPSSNMRTLDWNNELELIAKRWVMQCVFAHDVCRDTGKYPVGQNIAKGAFATSSDLSFIKDWFDAIDFFDKNEIGYFQVFKGPDQFLGRFTQMIWADTFQIGCARAVFQDGTGGNTRFREHFFCNYGPTGNIPGLQIYKVGQPCTACPEGTGCTVEYPALCGST